MIRVKRLAVVSYVSTVLATCLPAYGGWTWTTLDYPGASTTEAYDVSGSTIVGQCYVTAPGQSFKYDGTAWTTLSYPAASTTEAHGISGSNIVGRYAYADGAYHGFLYTGTTWTALNHPGATATEPTAVSGGRIVGHYQPTAISPYHGFLHDTTTKTWTTLDYPGAAGWGTYVYGIDGNSIVGQYQDESGVYHGFLYDGMTWTRIDYLGKPWRNTAVWGISGDKIIGVSSGDSFLYDGATWTTIDYPGTSGSTLARGISGNTIVGDYYDGHRWRGFVLTIPEPTTFALLVIGGLVLTRRCFGRYVDTIIPGFLDVPGAIRDSLPRRPCGVRGQDVTAR